MTDCNHRWDWFYGSDLIKHVVCVLCGWGDCCEVHRRRDPSESQTLA